MGVVFNDLLMKRRGALLFWECHVSFFVTGGCNWWRSQVRGWPRLSGTESSGREWAFGQLVEHVSHPLERRRSGGISGEIVPLRPVIT
jgi:hypothetical protein